MISIKTFYYFFAEARTNTRPRRTNSTRFWSNVTFEISGHCAHCEEELVFIYEYVIISLQWRHNERGGVSNHLHLDCLLHRLLRPRSKKTSNIHVTGFCEGNSPETGEFPTQRASNAEDVSIWWSHQVYKQFLPRKRRNEFITKPVYCELDFQSN